ncbi:hypothetical protein [Streptomyces caeruleatus]|nr:hypothetical protein [Streptomyces caeruleatus]
MFGVALQTLDLTEHTRLMGQVAPTLKALCAEVERIREGDLAQPVRDIA